MTTKKVLLISFALFAFPSMELKAATVITHNATSNLLSIDSNGILNLTDPVNPLDSVWGIVTTTMILGTATYSPPIEGIRIAVQNGYHGGQWDGSSYAITSTACKDYANYLGAGIGKYALAPLTGAEYRELDGDRSQFHGKAMSAATDNYALIQFTYAGDVNLDGKVDAADLLLVDLNMAVPPLLADWYSGDVNYDGSVDAADRNIVNQQIEYQHVSGCYAQLDTGVVPEPSALVMLGAGLLALICVRPGRRARK